MNDNNMKPFTDAQMADFEVNFKFDNPTLAFLLSHLTEEDKGVFMDIASMEKDRIGYQKTKVPDFHKNRRKYEISWAKLEGQGFIFIEKLGNMRVCRLTIRGKQLLKYLEDLEQKNTDSK